MTTRLPLPAAHSAFRDDEPVVQSHPLLPDARPLLFGQRDQWNLNGVVERPVNQYAANYRVSFAGLSPAWNLRAREMVMIWLNPRHPAVLAAGVHLKPQPREPRTTALRAGTMRTLAGWAETEGLPADLSRWDVEDFHRYIDAQRQRLTLSSVNEHVVVIKALHEFGPALACGGLPADPWPGRPASHVLGIRDTGELTTPVIPPETWFPLVRSAWTYIDVFGPDILRALALWQGLQATARTYDTAELTPLVTAWLADPQHRVPVRPAAAGDPAAAAVNWSVLTTMIGATNNVFNTGNPAGRHRRSLVLDAVAAGRTQPGLLNDLTEVTRPDGTRGPWHHCLHPLQLWFEAVALRNACYIFVAALSMMRDSEIRQITHDSVVQHYGSPAVVSTKRKRDPGLPARHWWIIEPAATAIFTASQLSLHPNLAFGRVRDGGDDEGFASQYAIDSFIRRVNTYRRYSGLPVIPDGRITPHMFRRTMSMLTRDHPGSEIALGIQLKHVTTRALANRATQGYANAAPAWARHLDDALSTTQFQRLQDLYDAHRRGESVGYGPAADRIRDTFDSVIRASEQAQHGDARVEYDLLRKARISIRFGKLNHCTLDEANPVGAKCLENTVVPAGHYGPLVDRCQPARCGNSLFGPEHVPAWRIEEQNLLTLLDIPKIAPCRKTALRRELDDVRAVLRKVT
ncbi:integrase [Amycolatopsis sp. lyj-23]|uniref:integrase n=1 Tax=Amycolatopsis sp. lyj-23 TaxID=2789283 RepID=UPI00397DD69E